MATSIDFVLSNILKPLMGESETRPCHLRMQADETTDLKKVTGKQKPMGRFKNKSGKTHC